MKALLCTLLGGILFFFSVGLGGIWPLAWFAPVPLLWLASGKDPLWRVLVASFFAYAIGQLNLFEAYAFIWPLLIVIMTMTSGVFAIAVLFARYAGKRLAPGITVFAFPAFWTGFEYVYSVLSPNSTFGSFSYSQIPAPVLIQSVSLFGLWSVTFLICLVAATVALVLRQGRRAAWVGVVVAILFAVNAAFGFERLAQSVGPTERVGAAADDALGFGETQDDANAVVQRYAQMARALAAKGAQTIVLPEKIAILSPQWSNEAAPLALAVQQTGSRIVAGFEEHADQNRNVALTFEPDGTIERYVKRHLVPGVELLAPGNAPGVFGGGRGVEICKDMDFPDTIRQDARLGVRMMYVPAWDFGADQKAHANMAIMRSVENGFSMVRAARDGLLTANDAEGRVIAFASSLHRSRVTILADLPEGPGQTIYQRIGDLFPRLCLLLVAVIALFAAFARAKNR
jgi:apolipoprotein N-acyltransferase